MTEEQKFTDGSIGLTVGILGGTGALGNGLARRWAAAGLEVAIGSRDADRATAAAQEIHEGAVLVKGLGLSACAAWADVVVVGAVE